MSILKNDRYYFICPFSPYLYSKRLSSKHCFFALVPFLKIVNHEIAIWQKIVQRKFVQLTLFCSEHFWQTNFKFKFSEICIIHIKWFWENLEHTNCSFYRALKHLNNYFAKIFTWKNFSLSSILLKMCPMSKQPKATKKWVKLSHHYFNALHL